MVSKEQDLHQLLKGWRDGNADARDKIFSCVYEELHKIAHQQLRKAWQINTLNTTALVHETYLKMVNQTYANWEDRSHFLAISARAMRQILLNYAERKQAEKRGKHWRKVTFDECIEAETIDTENFLAVEFGLNNLFATDQRLGQLVEMRFYGGMNEEEIGTVLGVTSRTVRRDWRKAKALLSLSMQQYNNAPP